MGVFVGLNYREEIEAQYGNPLLAELEQITASITESLDNIVDSQNSALNTTLVENITTTIVKSSLLKEQTTTSTGTVNNFDFTAGMPGYLRCNNSSALTLTGFTINGLPPSEGDSIIIDNIGSSTVKVADQDTGSVAANRLTMIATVGQIVGARGRLFAVYDSTTSRWRVTIFEKGGWINVTFSAGDFTGHLSMTWTVQSGDVDAWKFIQDGKLVTVGIAINTTVTGGTQSNRCLIAIPGGFVPTTKAATAAGEMFDGDNTKIGGYIRNPAAGTKFECWLTDGASWTLGDFMSVEVQHTFEVD